MSEKQHHQEQQQNGSFCMWKYANRRNGIS